MKAFNLKIVIWIFSLIVAGVSLNFLQTLQGHEVKMIRTLDVDGNTISSNILSPTTGYFFLDVAAKLCYASATSIFIAVFISGRIAASNQAKREEEMKQLQDAVRKDVFDALFLSLMPSELFETIKKQLIQKEIVVRGATWHYEYILSTQNAGWLSSRVTIRYSIFNRSKSELVESMQMTSMDGPDAKEKLMSAIGRQNGRDVLFYKIGTKSKDSNVRVEENFGGEAFMTRVSMDLRIPPSSSVDLTLVLKGEHEGNVTEAYFTKYPIVDGRITFQYPEEYEFGWAPSLSADVKMEIDEPDKKIFDITGGILPRQGFIFFLKLKKK